MLTKNYFTFPFYIPRIFALWVNWPQYLFDYISRRRGPAEYRMRNGVRLVDDVGELAGTMAVVFVRREYGPMKRFRTIVDIGAHLGSFAVYAANCCPDARIYCYEPEQRNFDLLKHNIGINEFQERVFTFPFAVGSEIGQRELAIDRSLSNSFHIISDEAARQTVDCTTLKQIFADHQLESIDLLKINCEGAEYEIIKSCSPAEFERIGNIRLEYHNLEGLGRNGESLSRFLKAQGYRIERFTRYLKTSGFIWATRVTLFAFTHDALQDLI
jgi:FkbM family methyltransferase